MLEISDKAAVIGGINCAGTEPELLECIHGSDGDHLCHRFSNYPDIIISCTGVYKQFLLKYNYNYHLLITTDKPRDCKNGDVRLQGGTNNSNGYVEICFHRHWLALCSDETDMDKAERVCNQLEFNPQGIIIYTFIHIIYTHRFTLTLLLKGYF